jgi:hypothetical protein
VAEWRAWCERGWSRADGALTPISGAAAGTSRPGVGVPTWRARRPDAVGFWETRFDKSLPALVERIVVYQTDDGLNWGENRRDVLELEESPRREWRGPILP